MTERGQKHLRELMTRKRKVRLKFYLSCNGGLSQFSSAHEVDPEYAGLLQQAQQAGVDHRGGRGTSLTDHHGKYS